MKIGTALIFGLLLLAEVPLFFWGSRVAVADTLQKERESKDKKRRRQLTPEQIERRARDPWFKMLASIEKTVGAKVPLYSGLVLMAGGFFYFLRTKGYHKGRPYLSRKGSHQAQSVFTWGKTGTVLIVIVVAGAVLRLYDLDEKSLDHTEIFVPGISLPKDLSAPPPRITFADTIWWHFHVEPHPPGYYFVMWPWTKILGTSEWVLRLPSVLLGIASIWLIFQIVAQTNGKTAALIAAALLAFNGHHIFWSQMARMYSMTCFLGLLSTYFLVRLVNSSSPFKWMEAGYAGASLFGVFTEIVYWPFLMAQALWAAIAMPNESNRPNRILRLQSIVMIIGTPLWAHAVYRARASHLEEPSLSFLQHFFAFGFLIQPDPFALQPQKVSWMIALPLLILSLLLVLLAFNARQDQKQIYTAPDSGALPILPIVTGAILTTIGFSLQALSRRPAMARTIFVAIVALFVPWILAKAASVVRWVGKRLGFSEFLESFELLYCLLAFLPCLVLFVLSYKFPLLGTRLFVLFVPFLLILIAIGLTRLLRFRVVTAAVIVILIAAHVFSVAHFHQALTTPNDYKGLAQEIRQRFRDGDLIFVRAKHWGITPLFYYFPDRHDALISKDFERALTEQGTGRVFVIHMEGLPPTPEMINALKNLPLREKISERRAFADVYER